MSNGLGGIDDSPRQRRRRFDETLSFPRQQANGFGRNRQPDGHRGLIGRVDHQRLIGRAADDDPLPVADFAFHHPSIDDIDAAFEKSAGDADYDQADWAVYFNMALLNTFYFVSDYVFVHSMAEALRKPDVNEAHRKLLGEMAPVANGLSEFTFGFAAAIFKRHPGVELTMP